MNCKLRQSFLFLLSFIAAKCLCAQTDTTVVALPELVVRTQRTAQKKQTVPFSLEVLGQEAIAAYGARTTPEALGMVNGVFIQKTNHGGGSPFIRGLTGNQTLILIDGIRLNNAIFRYGPNQYLNTIDPYTIRQVEVAKGTGSVQYGSDALGGVIHVLTSDPEPGGAQAKWSGTLLGKWVSNGMEQTGRGTVQYAAKKFALSGGVTLRNFGDLIGGDTTGRQQPSGYGEKAFDIKGKFLLGKKISLVLAHQTLQQDDVPVYHKIKLENFAVNKTSLQQRSLSYARLLVPAHTAWLKEMVVTASYQKGKEHRESRKLGNDLIRQEKDAVGTAGFTIDFLTEAKSWWQINSGVELYHDRVSSKSTDINSASNMATPKRGLYPNGAGYGNYSLYALNHFYFKAWTAEAGIRYNTFRIKLQDTTLGKVRLHPSSFVYNAGLLRRLDQHQNVFVNFSTGYRAPNIDDMGTLGIVDFRYEIPSASLQPEKSRHVEAGYRWNSTKFSVDAAFYFLRLRHLITRVKMEGEQINGYPVYQKENVEAAYVKGAEISAKLLLLPSLWLQGGLAYAYGQNTTRNEPLRRTPPFNGRMLLQYRRQHFHAAIEGAGAAAQQRLAKGDTEDNRIPKGGTPGWTVLNIYAGYQYRFLQINTGVTNLTNKDYRTHGSGINGMGRSVWCALAVQW